MRLSEVLNKAPDTSETQVEGFLGAKKLGWGKHRGIEVGKVIRNHFCRKCNDMRSFISGDVLSCLMTGERSVSIDVTIRCAACESPMEAWFLVGCTGDFFSQTPVVHLERFTENRRDVAGSATSQTGQLDDLFERAQIAYDDRLGAGSMIYLRKIFEMVTSQAAAAAEIATVNSNGRRKTFKGLLKEVDTIKHIIPAEFSNNGYQLFSELSEVIHGESDEGLALTKYGPCRKLVFGIVANVRNNQEMAHAIASLGWDEGALTQVLEEGETA